MNESDFSQLNIDKDACFLCGEEAEEITSEHVFPKWLQQRYNLWNAKLDLLNGTNIPYRSLKVPCCGFCNSGSLARMEGDMAPAVQAGYSACAELDSRLWYLWLGKIFFGILRKEVSLLHDRSRPDSGPILPPEAIEFFSNLHMFLQGIRAWHEFGDQPPYSVLVCNLHDLGPRRNFCFADNLHYLTAAIRMGEVGVIVAFEDVGINAASFGRYVAKVAGRKLHPIQFNELYAKVTYQTHLMESSVKYLTSQQVEGATPMRTDVFWSGRLRDWSQYDFSRVLRFHVCEWLTSSGTNMSWYEPPNLVPTWMVDADGELLLKTRSSWEGESESET